MDLAKIRQKAREERDAIQAGRDLPPVDAPKQQQPVAIEPVVAENSFFPVDAAPAALPLQQTSAAVVPAVDPAPFAVSERSVFIPPVRDPLSVILAGRAAAGCDEDLPLASGELDEQGAADCLEFLCFRVADELYGINIMEIKEIIKPRETTEVPRSPSFVAGVISLRGTIIPIIDMRERLGLFRNDRTGKERVIVVKLHDSLSGLQVDEIVQVVRVPANNMEAAPAVLDGIDRDFVNAIGRADGTMIIILNSESIADITLI